MLNPFGNEEVPGPYQGLLMRLTRNVRDSGLEGDILKLAQETFEKKLGAEHLVLSKPERVRLFRQVTKTILTEILAGLEE